jgi:hypothetical protein
MLQTSGTTLHTRDQAFCESIAKPFPPLSHFPEPSIDLRFLSSQGSGSGSVHTHIDSGIGGFTAQLVLLATMFVYDPVCTVLLLCPVTFEYEPLPQGSFALLLLGILSLTSHPPRSFLRRDFEDRSCTHRLNQGERSATGAM